MTAILSVALQYPQKPQIDTSRGYAFSSRLPQSVMVAIGLSEAERAKMSTLRSRQRRLDLVFGKALSWRYVPGDEQAVVYGQHGLTHNAHDTNDPHEIARRTLQVVKAGIARL